MKIVISVLVIVASAIITAINVVSIRRSIRAIRRIKQLGAEGDEVFARCERGEIDPREGLAKLDKLKGEIMRTHS